MTATGEAVYMKPCPWCDCEDIRPWIDHGQGGKYGAMRCQMCEATGPSVRTACNWNDDAPWHKDAAEAWNTRKAKGK